MRGRIRRPKPLSAQLSLTYRCNLNCVHCYCIGSEQKERELITSEWKYIIDRLHAEGIIFLVLTGGEPLIREDFLDIYTYAKNKGFLVTVFTNGLLVNDKIINHLARYAPYSIEVTLNGITKKTYESITQVSNSFKKALAAINKIVRKKLPLILKCNGLAHNKHEILKIKAFAEKILGKRKFKFDSFITPRLNHAILPNPIDYRLTAEEIQSIEEGDKDMTAQRDSQFLRDIKLPRKPEYLYQCNSWFKKIYISPSGRLKFCYLSDKYSSDLKNMPFEKAFYHFGSTLEERFISDSKCTQCNLREFCSICPASAFLEEGDEEAPIPYFCDLARIKKERYEENMSMRLATR